MESDFSRREVLTETQHEGSDDEWPEGDAVPLNLKRNTVTRLRRVAAALGVPSNVSITDTRLMIEGKLNEMGHDPRNVQVVAQGDGDDLPLYLVSDVGIIRV